MKIWKDAKEHEYHTQITVAEVRALKSELGINLMEIATGDLLQKISEDVCLLCDILYVIHRDEAQKYGISDEDFGRNLYGDALEDATKAFVEETVNFFPNAKTRALLNKAMTKGQERMDKTLEKAEIELEKELNKPIE
jgi:hypothetical protein